MLSCQHLLRQVRRLRFACVGQPSRPVPVQSTAAAPGRCTTLPTWPPSHHVRDSGSRRPSHSGCPNRRDLHVSGPSRDDDDDDPFPGGVYGALSNSKWWLAGAVVAVYVYAVHLEDCPITGRRRFVALPERLMSLLGDAFYKFLLFTCKKRILSEQDPAHARVARVCDVVLEANRDLKQVQGKPWTITVIREDTENAFALPGNHIFVYTAMLGLCGSDEELAVVLSHEIAHCLLNHYAESLSYTGLVSVLTTVPLALLWTLVSNDSNYLKTLYDSFFEMMVSLVFELPRHRVQESEADEVGLVLASKACLDVRAFPQFWSKLAKMEYEWLDLPEFARTHPTHEHRATNLAKQLPTALKLRLEVGCDELGPQDIFLRRRYFPSDVKGDSDVASSKGFQHVDLEKLMPRRSSS